IQVNTTIDQDQAESANATSADGSRVVVWTDYSTGNGDIKAQRFDAVGHRVGGEISVTSLNLNEHEPDVAMDANGNFVVVWTRDESQWGPGGTFQKLLGQRRLVRRPSCAERRPAQRRAHICTQRRRSARRHVSRELHGLPWRRSHTQWPAGKR